MPDKGNIGCPQLPAYKLMSVPNPGMNPGASRERLTYFL